MAAPAALALGNALRVAATWCVKKAAPWIARKSSPLLSRAGRQILKSGKNTLGWIGNKLGVPLTGAALIFGPEDTFNFAKDTLFSDIGTALQNALETDLPLGDMLKGATIGAAIGGLVLRSPFMGALIGGGLAWANATGLFNEAASSNTETTYTAPTQPTIETTGLIKNAETAFNNSSYGHESGEIHTLPIGNQPELALAA